MFSPTNKIHTFILFHPPIQPPCIFLVYHTCLSFPLTQMSLMDHAGVRPITAVAWTSNSSTCPKDFTLVGTEIKIYTLLHIQQYIVATRVTRGTWYFHISLYSDHTHFASVLELCVTTLKTQSLLCNVMHCGAITSHCFALKLKKTST